MAHRGFWRELKRRHVYRVAAAYAIVGWLLIQVATQVFPVFHLPDWIDQAVVLLILLGFPIALVLAWAFDATPHGIVRTDAQDHVGSPVRRRSHRAGFVVGLVGVVIAVGAGGAWWHLQRDRFATPSATTSSATAAVAARPNAIAAQPISTKSVAVLPFANESGDKDQQYFSDGLSEELISALGQVHDLKVIGRNSSFRFRGNAQNDSAGIAAKLGVATLLEGTVRKQGDEVRIVASLIKARDGSVLWSQSYDRPLKDVFAMQGQIATSVATALKVTLLTEPANAGAKPPNGNMVAYDAMLQGRYYAEHRNRADYYKAVRYYEQAIALDPDYVLAYARLAIAQQWFIDWEADYNERMTTSPLARANAQKAVALAPESAAALGALGSVEAWTDFDYPAAEATLKKAVALDPSNAEVVYQLADVTGCLGRLDEAVTMMHKALVLEPLNASFHYYTGEFLLALGKLDQAEAELKRAIALQPGADAYGSTLGVVLMKRGQFDQALAAAKTDPNGQSRRQALSMIYFAMGDKVRAQAQLSEEIRLDGGDTPGLIAGVYAYEGNADPAFAWLDRALQVRDSSLTAVYEAPDIVQKLGNDPRFAALCKKAGLPTPAEVKAQVARDATRG